MVVCNPENGTRKLILSFCRTVGCYVSLSFTKVALLLWYWYKRLFLFHLMILSVINIILTFQINTPLFHEKVFTYIYNALVLRNSWKLIYIYAQCICCLWLFEIKKLVSSWLKTCKVWSWSIKSNNPSTFPGILDISIRLIRYDTGLTVNYENVSPESGVLDLNFFLIPSWFSWIHHLQYKCSTINNWHTVTLTFTTKFYYQGRIENYLLHNILNPSSIR